MYKNDGPRSQRQWFSSAFMRTERRNPNRLLRHYKSDSVYKKKMKPHKQYSQPLENSDIEMVNLLSDSDDDIVMLGEVKSIKSDNMSHGKNCSRSCNDNNDDISAVEKSQQQHPSVTNNLRQRNCVPFVQQFRPTSIGQLAVHSKKIEEVKLWLTNHQGLQKQHKLLLLLGPCGTGKTATVRVLCKVLKLELTEWESRDQFTVLNLDGEESVKGLSQVQVFEEFLKKADIGTLEKRHVQRLVLIEQIPNAFYREPNNLHMLLHRYATLSSCIFVFVMSVVDSSWYLNPKRIFSPSVITELHMDVILFNSAALSLLQKAIKNVLDALNVKASTSQIRRIAESGAGDIRVALNNLQLCLKEDGKLMDTNIFSSSSQLDTFHCIGKLMYAKRVESNNLGWNIQEGHLSRQLLSSNCKRLFPLKDDVNEVIVKSGLSGEKLASFIHEHELSFCGTVDNIAKVFDNISLMDSVPAQWYVRGSFAMSEYEAQVSARSAAFYNYGHKPSGRHLYNFHKPKWDSVKYVRETLQKDSLFAFPEISLDVLFSAVLPVLSEFNDDHFDSLQWQVFSRIYSKSRFGRQYMSKNCNHHRPLLVKDDVTVEEEEFDIEEVED